MDWFVNVAVIAIPTLTFTLGYALGRLARYRRITRLSVDPIQMRKRRPVP